jgi:hypothetical protein
MNNKGPGSCGFADMSTAAEKWLRGAAAGSLATIPMTLAMLMVHRLLPAREQYSLPPRLITENWLGRGQGETALRAWTLINHFGFGALAGSLYSGLGIDKERPAIAGPAFGVAVWAVSYLGWVPVLGLMAPATRQPARRNGMMIFAHLVWGAALAAALSRSEAPSPRRSQGKPGDGSHRKTA